MADQPAPKPEPIVAPVAPAMASGRVPSAAPAMPAAGGTTIASNGAALESAAGETVATPAAESGGASAGGATARVPRAPIPIAKMSPAPPAAAKKSAADALADLESSGRLSWMTVAPSWLVSLIVHVVLLVILALLVQPQKLINDLRDLVATSDQPTEPLEEIKPELADQATELEQTSGLPDAVSLPDQTDGMEITELSELATTPRAVELSDIGLERAPITDLTQELGKVGGMGLEGRGDAARKALLHERGGSEGSENAVALALAWLAQHQQPDGSWSFDHRRGACQARCNNPGRMARAEIAGTAIALLPFLGAGQTHVEGKYKKNVQAGLYFLVNRMKIGPNGGDMAYEMGTMYGHGLASIALCEAYAMTEDRGLAVPAQKAIDFIVYAQDPVAGGWRYQPRQPGDTSVVGWQLMALKSAHMAYLRVPPATVKGAANFLNTVQVDSGSAYGYVDPGRGAATTAIGLLCRMYLGWKHDEPALERGVQFLSALGPSSNNMYYNYYATQVLHHYDGEPWEKWNNRMRDFLVNSQAQQGHEKGSWYFGGEHSAESGGRLYTTAMAAMTLEVYYRHLPIYRKQSTNDDFDE